MSCCDYILNWIYSKFGEVCDIFNIIVYYAGGIPPIYSWTTQAPLLFPDPTLPKNDLKPCIN